MQVTPSSRKEQFGFFPPALLKIVDRHPVTVTLDTPVTEVLTRMSTVNSCIVVKEGLQPVGVFTSQDVVRLALGVRPDSRMTISEVMNQSVRTVGLDELENFSAVLSKFQQHQSPLVVVDNLGNLVGVITETGLLAAMHQVDIHGLQQLIKSDRLLATTAQLIQRSLRVSEIFDATLTETRQLLECDRVLIYQFEPDWNGTVTAESVQQYISILGDRINDTYFASTKGVEYLLWRKQVVNNIYESQLNPCHLALLERLQVQATLTVPIIVNNQLWGLLGAHQCDRPRQWLREEVELLEKLSVQIAIAIQQESAVKKAQKELKEKQKVENDLQQLKKKLEISVRDRTLKLATAVEQLQSEVEERKKVEAALQESNQTLNNILESITEGFFALDNNWNFTHFNNLLEPILQRQGSELIGKNIWSEFPETIGTAFEKAYRSASEEQKLVSFEEFYPALNMWLEVRVYPSADRGISVYFRDISDRKNAEEALRESEERFRVALKNSPIIVFYQDTDLRYTWIYNPALGYDPSEVIGKDETGIFPRPEDAKKIGDFKREILLTGMGGRKEFTIVNDSEMECYDLSVDPLLNAEGEIIGVTCAALNITPRKKAEQALEESQRFIQRIADSTPNILYIYDLIEKRNVYSNRGIAEILGYTPQEIQEMGAEVLAKLIHPDDLTSVYRQHEKFDTAKDGDIIEIEYRMKDASGLWRWLYSWDTVFNRTSDGVPKQILGTASDITALKLAQDQLRKNNEILATTNAQLARATRMKDEFLANMSHELRTPLNAVLGMSEGLLDELCGSLTPQQRKAIATIEKSGKHLLSLINDILDLAKVESGNLELQITRVPVVRVVESSLTFIKQQAHKKNLKLSSKVAQELGEINVDERRMKQVLINLLSNAIKFTPSGGSIKIEVTADTEEGRINFSVSDTGIGIAPENMNKLFKSFVQIDSSLSRSYEGTGLGLALVRRIVELHEGSVSVESEVGKGSCFTVVLPNKQEDRELVSDYLSSLTTSSEQNNAIVEKVTNNPEPPLILLAEDNEANIETISSYLLALGYRLAIAINGWEAVLMAKKHKPNLILMDIQMPEMDGLTATRQIRADSDTAKIPIIALTALAMPGDRQKCLEAGVSEYMKKPVSLKQLAQTIHNFFTTTS